MWVRGCHMGRGPLQSPLVLTKCLWHVSLFTGCFRLVFIIGLTSLIMIFFSVISSCFFLVFLVPLGLIVFIKVGKILALQSVFFLDLASRFNITLGISLIFFLNDIVNCINDQTPFFCLEIHTFLLFKEDFA